jgi:hypothetical protein
VNLALETTGRTARAGDDGLVSMKGEVAVANCGSILIEAGNA